MSTKLYGVGDVAKMFFDRTTEWMRYRERKGFFTRADGTVIGSRDPNERGGGGDRVYTLDDVAELASSLHAKGALDDRNLGIVMGRVQAHRSTVSYLRSEAPVGP